MFKKFHISSLAKSKVKCLLFCFFLIIGFQNSYGQADLAIQGASITPTSVPAGNTITATSTIYNLGNTAVSVSTIGYYLSADNRFDQADVFIGSSSGNYLAAASQYDASSYRHTSLTIPNNTPTGAYYILFVADYLASVTEANENNNVSFVSFSLVPATVDLIISSAYSNSSSVAPGNTVSFETYISNQGNSRASSSNVGYYLSTNNTLDNTDAFIGSSNGSSLATGESYNFYSSLTIPTGTTPGNYYIIAVADYLNSVSESIETNNTTSRSITIVSPSVDLVIRSPYLSNYAITAGGYVSAYFYVANTGNSTASSSNVGIYLSVDNTLDNSDVFISPSGSGSLSANNNHYHSPYFTIPNGTLPGTYYVIVVADYLNSVIETNENNNADNVALTIISPNVDFTLNSFSASTTVSAGNNINTYITIYNTGNTSAPASSVGYYLSANNTLETTDTFIGSTNVSSLYAGSSDYNRSTTLTIPSTTVPGSYYIIAVADYLNNVTENNESNNATSAAIRITASGTSFMMPASGSTSFTTCSGTLFDSGGADNYSNSVSGTMVLNPATAGNKIRLIFSSFNVESCCDRLTIYDGTSTSAPFIGSYTSNPGTIYATNSAGALTLVFSTDGSVVSSGFEAEIACVTTVPLPDLTILNPVASPTSVAAGMSLDVSASVTNQGAVTASSSNLGYYLSTNTTFETSDVYLGYASGYSLASNNPSYRSNTLSIPANTTPGNYYILYVADYSSNVTEDSETNNVANVAVTVTAPTIDLTMLSAFTSASTLAAGNVFTVSSFIANQGSTPSGSSTVGYYLSANNTLETSDTYLGNSYGSTLTGGNSTQRDATLTLPTISIAGTYYILFVADYENAITETNENNNTRSVAVTVTSPNYVDLAISTKSLERTTLFLGESVSASSTIINNGNITAPRSAVGFYLSTNTSLDAADILLNSAVSSGVLAPNAAEEVVTRLTIPRNTAPGNYYIIFQPDYNNQVVESEETSGYTYIAVTITSPSVDLAVQNQSVSPSTLGQGNSMQLFSVLENHGNTSATNARTGYYLSANTTLEASDLLLGFSAGNTEIPARATSDYQHSVFTIPVTTAPGAYYVLFVADYNNTITETNETNNITFLPLTINAALPNLRIFNINATPTTVVAGNLVSVGDSINNQGYAAAVSSNIGYYLSANTTLDASDILLDHSTGGSLDFMGNAGDASMSYRVATLTIPGTTAAGSYYILSVADYTNTVTEISETDNVSSVAIRVNATNVDLLVQNQSISPANIAAGNAITVAGSISNQGTTPATTSTVSYYLSGNTTFESGDILLGTSTGTNLAAGSSAYRTAVLTIPANTLPGTYQILFIADPGNSVIETNETNNSSRATITIASPTAVDLVIQAPSGFPTTVTAGNALDVTSYIYNQGGAVASASSIGYYLSTNVMLDASDILLSTAAGGSLTANASSSRAARLTIPANITAGNYYILFVADQANTVAESMETNNVASTTISVTAPLFADFSVQNPAITPASLLAGNSVNVTATIRNQGTAPASGSIGYYLSTNNSLDAADVLLNLSTSTNVEPGASATKTATLTIPAGTSPGNYHLLLIADYNNAVAESDEINNLNSVILTVIAPNIDLMVQNQRATPTSVLAGTSISVSSAITNQGNLTASSGIVGYYLSTNATLQSTDILLGSSISSNIAAESSVSKTANLSLPAGTTAGTYYILFVADYTNTVTETNESNNMATATITVVAPTIDLALQATALSDTEVTSGDTIAAATTIHNQGNAPASSSYIRYYLSSNNTYESSDVLLGSKFESAVAAGTSESKIINLIIPANTAAGNYYILLIADAGNTVAESNETNNTNNVALTVSARHIDLAVHNQAVSPGSVVAGNTISVSSAIINNGTSAAPSSSIGYYLSTNPTLESTDILLGNSTGGALAAGATAAKTTTLTVPANRASGSYYIIFVADHTRAVTETNELNNLGTASLTITAPTAPDFTVQAPTFSSTNLIPGGAFEINTIISNQGTAAASSSTIGYYLSANNTLDAADVFLNSGTGTGTLAVGSTTSISAMVTVPANTTLGAYYIIAVADYLNSTAESNETNNTNSVAVTVVVPNVDLVIQSPTIERIVIAPNSSVITSATIANTGTANASSSNIGTYLSTDTSFDETDILLANSTGGSLLSGASSSRSGLELVFGLPINTSPESYYILYVADPANTVAENNETNNVSSIAITVTASSVDLVIQNVRSSPVYTPGNVTSFGTIIYNQGTTLAYSSNVGIYLSNDKVLDQSDLLLETITGDALSFGYSGDRMTGITIPAGTVGGNYYLLVVADYSNLVNESDETNNMQTVDITVLSTTIQQPDLVIQSPSLSKLNLHNGSTVIAKATIANTGTLVASASSIGYYLSTDSIYDTSDIALGSSGGISLAPGTSMEKTDTLTIPSDITQGSYFILYVTDHTHIVNESSETNNVNYLEVRIDLPTGIKKPIVEQEVSLFPNPASEKLNLLIDGFKKGEKEASVTIYNAKGGKILTRQVPISHQKLTATFDVTGLSRGMYMVQVHADDNLITRQVIIE